MVQRFEQGGLTRQSQFSHMCKLLIDCFPVVQRRLIVQLHVYNVRSPALCCGLPNLLDRQPLAESAMMVPGL